VESIDYECKVFVSISISVLWDLGLDYKEARKVTSRDADIS
jgi:hypothetical protein